MQYFIFPPKKNKKAKKKKKEEFLFLHSGLHKANFLVLPMCVMCNSCLAYFQFVLFLKKKINKFHVNRRKKVLMYMASMALQGLITDIP